MKKVSSEKAVQDIRVKPARSISQRRRSGLFWKGSRAECPLMADSGRSGPKNV